MYYINLCINVDSLQEIYNNNNDNEAVILISDDEDKPIGPRRIKRQKIHINESNVPSGKFVEQNKENSHLNLLSKYQFLDIIYLPSIEEILLEQKKEVKFPMTKAYIKDEMDRISYLNGLYVPKNLRIKILDSFHLSPPFWHPGAKKMKSLIIRAFNWPLLHQDITRYLQSCLTCARSKSKISKKRYIGQPHPLENPFSNLYIDFWGPFQWRGKEYILLTMIDHFTKWAEVALLINKTADEVAKTLFIVWISRYGAPKTIHTDNEMPLVSKSVEILCNLLKIKLLKITPYHPNGNSPIERFHLTLKQYLMKLRPLYDKLLDIDEALAWSLLNYRALIHTSTGYSPAYLALGWDIILKKSDEITATYNLNNLQISRLQLLQEIRQDIRQQFNVKNLDRPELKSNELFELDKIVLLELNEAQKRRLADFSGSGLKLVPNWSLPMRVIQVNRLKTVATLRCLTTGYTTQAHFTRTQPFLSTLSMSQHQEQELIIENEKSLFLTLIRNSDNKQKLIEE